MSDDHQTTAHVRLRRDADGDWYAKDRCFCGNDWPPHNRRATFGHKTAADAIRRLRELRREDRRQPGEIASDNAH